MGLTSGWNRCLALVYVCVWGVCVSVCVLTGTLSISPPFLGTAYKLDRLERVKTDTERQQGINGPMCIIMIKTSLDKVEKRPRLNQRHHPCKRGSKNTVFPLCCHTDCMPESFTWIKEQHLLYNQRGRIHLNPAGWPRCLIQTRFIQYSIKYTRSNTSLWCSAGNEIVATLQFLLILPLFHMC